MKKGIKGIFIIGLALLLGVVNAAAQPADEVILGYMPVSGDVPGWEPDGPPQTYRGEELFRMINGGADIYHEYGFSQVVRTTYLTADGNVINLEVYRMESPAAAYGIYTFKVGEGGKPLPIGQEACLQDYYLNFWKGDLLVTVIGLDSDTRTVQGVVDLAKAVNARIVDTGKKPDLAEVLLGEPLGFSNAKYVRGPLGVMGSYIFDTENIFRVREGMVGLVGDCQAFVFRYPDEEDCARTYEQAVAKLAAGERFRDGARQGNQLGMVGRDQESIIANHAGPFIAIVIGPSRDRTTLVSNQLVKKIRTKGTLF